MALPVTILYGSLSILVTVLLALNISLNRMRVKTYVSEGVPDALRRKIRAHGNSVEWLAVTIFLLAFLELQGVPSMRLHVLGGAVVIARILHSFCMLTGSRLTMVSATATYILCVTMTVWSLALRLH
jgi:uncharacterized membrane protein YecN with MAPEG domain